MSSRTVWCCQTVEIDHFSCVSKSIQHQFLDLTKMEQMDVGQNSASRLKLPGVIVFFLRDCSRGQYKSELNLIEFTFCRFPPVRMTTDVTSKLAQFVPICLFIATSVCYTIRSLLLFGKDFSLRNISSLFFDILLLTHKFVQQFLVSRTLPTALVMFLAVLRPKIYWCLLIF